MAIKNVSFQKSSPSDPYADAERQRALADYLQQQSVAPTVSPVPLSNGNAIGLGLTKLATALLARRAGKQADTSLADANAQSNTSNDALIRAMSGSPQTELDNVEGSGSTPLQSTLKSPTSGQPISQQGFGIEQAMAGQDPRAVSQALTQMRLAQLSPKPAYDLAPGAVRFSGDSNQPVAVNPKETTPTRAVIKTRSVGNGYNQDYLIDPTTGKEQKQGDPYKENPSKAAVAGQTSANLSPDATHDAVIDVLSDPARMRQYASFGQSGQSNRTLINNEKANLLRSIGMTEQEVIRQQAVAKAQIKSVADLVPMQNALQAYETVARGNGERVLELIKKVNTSGIPVLNSAIRLGKQATGNPDAAELMQVLQNYQTEVARIIANPRLVGQLTDTARKEIENSVPGNLTPAQAERIVNRLNFEFDLRNQGIANAVDTAQGQMVPGFIVTPEKPVTPTGDVMSQADLILAGRKK